MGAYTLLTVAMTYPVAFHLKSAVPGSGGDTWLFFWDLWWVKRALVDLHTDPFFTTAVYYPYGTSLYYHSLVFFPSLLALPVVAISGLTLAYNLLMMLSFVAGGYGAYRLMLHLLRSDAHPSPHDSLAAFLAGTVFTFSAYHLQRARCHLDLASIEWLPFYVLFLSKSWTERGWRNPLVAALLLAMTSLTSWYYGLYLVLFTGVFVGHRAVTERPLGAPISRIAMAAAACAMMLGPVLGPMLAQGPSAGHVPDPAGDALRFSADLGAFVLPSPLHPLWGRWLQPIYEHLKRDGNVTESVVSFGVVPLMLALVAARPGGRGRRFWLLALGFFTVMALGSELHVAGRTVSLLGHPVPLPYSLLQRIPYVDVGRTPSRMAVMGQLCVAVLAGYGARPLMARSHLVFPLLLGAALFETATLPLPMTRPTVPRVYDTIARDPRGGAVLEVPIPDTPARYPERMLYQTHHGKPSYGGYLSRGLPPLPFHSLPGFAQLQSLSPRVTDIVPYDDAALPEISRAVLSYYNAGYVVVDKTLLEPSELVRARAQAREIFNGATPFQEDDATATWAVPRAAPTQPFLLLGAGWSYLEPAPADPTRETGHWRWMGERGGLLLFAPRPLLARLKLRAWSLGRRRRVTIALDGTERCTLEVGQQIEVRRSEPLAVPAGVHALELRSLDGVATATGGTAQGRSASIAVSEVRLEQLAPLSGGERLDLGSERAEAYLGSGWSRAEGAFRWTDGGAASIHLPWAEPAFLEMRLSPFLAASRRAQRLTLSLGSDVLGTWVLRHTTPEVLRVALPAQALAPGAALALDLPDAESPARLGVSADPRRLGVAMEWLKIESPPVYAPGARIDFATKAADKYLGSGWSAPEPAFRWTDGPTAQVAFSLDRVQPLVLQMELQPFVAPPELPQQRIAIDVNGHRLGRLDLSAPGVRSVTVPAAVLRTANVLQLGLPDAQSPASLLGSSDARRLGVAVRWIRALPQD